LVLAEEKKERERERERERAMEVANADGFVFKRRRKEETSTSAQEQQHQQQQQQRQKVHVEEYGASRYAQARVQEQEETGAGAGHVNVVYGMAREQQHDDNRNGARRRKSFIHEETSFPPYPVGGAVLLPADGEDTSIGQGEKLLKLCHEVSSNECRNVSRTFVGKAEEISHLVDSALQKFEDKLRGLVQQDNINFLSKESRELNTRKQTMQRLVDSLECELKSWSEIKDAEGSSLLERSYAEKEEEGRRIVKEESVEGQLAAAYNDTINKMDIKVNNLVGLVKSVESLCGQTEKYTKDLQTKYHKQTFNPLPHVNSPANLIKSLLKPTV